MWYFEHTVVYALHIAISVFQKSPNRRSELEHGMLGRWAVWSLVLMTLSWCWQSVLRAGRCLVPLDRVFKQLANKNAYATTITPSTTPPTPASVIPPLKDNWHQILTYSLFFCAILVNCQCLPVFRKDGIAAFIKRTFVKLFFPITADWLIDWLNFPNVIIKFHGKFGAFFYDRN